MMRGEGVVTRRQALMDLGYDHDPQLQYQIDVQRRRSELLQQYHPQVYEAEQDYARKLLQGDEVNLTPRQQVQRPQPQSQSIPAPVYLSKESQKAAAIYLNEFLQTKQAAEQGDAKAQSKLGNYYYVGDGYGNVPIDKAKSIELYTKSAEQGNAQAQEMLGERFYMGAGVPKDDAKAFEWYKKAADQGNSSAQWWIGNMYHDGKGVPKDISKAIEWYKKSADHGDLNARSSLSEMATKGECVNAGVPMKIPGIKGAVTEDSYCE